MTHDPIPRTSLRALGVCALLGLGVALGGCHDLTASPGLPAGTPSPSIYNNEAGAIGMRNAAIAQFEQALAIYLVDAGLLTDELTDNNIGASQGVLLANPGVVHDPLDERILPAGDTVTSYTALQGVRTATAQALGALARYDTSAVLHDSVTVLRGELYAVEGYTEIMLADLFCSGVPLSYLVYQGDFQYEPGSSTAQVYADAIAKFDTALTLAHANDSVVHLAQLGQARANLDLGKYPAADDDVTNIPSGFAYQFAINWGGSTNSIGQLLVPDALNYRATVADTEGHNGLPFLTSGDPRTATAVVLPADPNSAAWPYVPITFPAKYGAALTSPYWTSFILASGVEAQLIEAEAQLNNAPGGGQWLATLNSLRGNIVNLQTLSNNSYDGDTALPALADPGAALSGQSAMAARLRLLFRERAYWLFLDGHRQGDLRRLIRQYGRDGFSSTTVYPIGPYNAPGTGFYGNDVVAPVPATESANPYFHGCLSNVP